MTDLVELIAFWRTILETTVWGSQPYHQECIIKTIKVLEELLEKQGEE